MEQKKAFISYEADAWFERNKALIEDYNSDDDQIIKLLKAYKINCESVLEIGSSAGYRLQGVKDILGAKKAIGVEPSKLAIEYGQSQFPEINFIETTADDLILVEDQSIDVVIMGFVFYVIDRGLVIKVMAEIDRVLKDKGHLILVDFFAETTLKRKYHHIDSFGAYSFKQKYDEMFTATKQYHLLDRSCFNHESKSFDSSEDFSNLYSVSLLKKDSHVSYK